MRELSSCFFITLTERDVKNIYLSVMLNLGLFRNTLTANDNYPVRDSGNLLFRFKCNYLENQKHFLVFLFHSWNLHEILNILKQKMIVITTSFRKLETVKDFVRPISKKDRFRTPFAWGHFHQIFSLLSKKLIWKISPLVTC